ncbi:FMRFamide peptide receptor frpr-18-like [Lineus longissimus]|uniref:FMRFamide peptide receptor frpr-18-like n=1 Tax=Lineus longissimus TaxID=88925 RepID=UPI00315C6D80
MPRGIAQRFSVEGMKEGENSSVDFHTLKADSPTADQRTLILQTILYIVDVYLPPVIIPVGVFGNILSWLLMSQPHYRHSTNSLYMRFLAFSDSLYLLTRATQRWLLVIIPELLTAPAVHKHFCRQYLFFESFCQMVSSELLVVMTADRLIAIMFPLKSKLWLTMFRARLCLLGIILVSLTIHLPAFWRINHPKFSTWLCPFHFPYDVLFQTITTIINPYIPICLLFVFNTAIIATVKRTSSKRDKMSGKKLKGEKENDNNITRTLLVVSFTYLICLLPFKAQIIIFTEWKPTHDKVFWKLVDRLTLDLTITFEFCNYALNSYLYLLVSERFRKELKGLICGRPPSKLAKTSVS